MFLLISVKFFTFVSNCSNLDLLFQHGVSKFDCGYFIVDLGGYYAITIHVYLERRFCNISSSDDVIEWVVLLPSITIVIVLNLH